MSSAFPPFPPSQPRFARRDTAMPQADLYPMGREYNGLVETGHFIADERWEQEITEKLDLLAAGADLRRCIIEDDAPGLTEALWRVADLLAIDEPTLWQVTADGALLPRLGLRLVVRDDRERRQPAVDASVATQLGLRVAAWLERQTGLNRLLDAIALACQEDIVIMRGVPDGVDIAEALHVCFPSGWDPREKVGTGFAAIHAPVAENERLIGSSPNLMKALLTKGPYVRFGWGITVDPRLDHHTAVERHRLPLEMLTDPAAVAAATYVRTERQTTAPMPDLGRGLFTIRVYVDPLTERIRDEPFVRERLISLIETATPAVRDYKGISELAEPLLAWLRNDLASSSSTAITHQG